MKMPSEVQQALANLEMTIDACKRMTTPTKAAVLEDMMVKIRRELDESWYPIDMAPKSTGIETKWGTKVDAVYLLGYMPDALVGDNHHSAMDVIWWEPHMNSWWSALDIPIKPAYFKYLPEFKVTDVKQTKQTL